jgi:hypothetical protein
VNGPGLTAGRADGLVDAPGGSVGAVPEPFGAEPDPVVSLPDAVHLKLVTVPEGVAAEAADLLLDALCQTMAKVVGDGRARTGVAPDVTVRDLLEEVLSRRHADWLTGGPMADALDMRAVDIVGRLADRYDWREVIETAWVQLNERDRALLDQLVPGAHEVRRTLESVGADHGVTRERVRQLYLNARQQLDASEVVGRAVERFAKLVTPSCSLEMLRAAGFDPVDDHTRLLASLAVLEEKVPINFNLTVTSAYGIDWVVAHRQFDVLHEVTEILSGEPEHTAPIATAKIQLGLRLAGRVTSHEAGVVTAKVFESDRLHIFEDHLLDWSGSKLDKARRLLTAAGRPLPRTTLIAEIGNGVMNQIFTKEGRECVVRTMQGEFALPEWPDVVFHEDCLVLMKRLITAHGGQMSTRRLIREVTAAGYKEKSAVMYGTMRPEFRVDAETIRLVDPNEVSTRSPEHTRGLYRVLSGPERGCWSWTYTVDYWMMTRHSTIAPGALAALLGLSLEVADTIDVNGLPVKCRWAGKNLRLFSRASFTDAVRALEAEDDERVQLAIVGARTMAASVRPAAVGSDAGPAEALVDLLSSASVETSIEDVAFAVGFDGVLDENFTADDVLERLNDRRDPLGPLLLAIHPELAE